MSYYKQKHNSAIIKSFGICSDDSLKYSYTKECVNLSTVYLNITVHDYKVSQLHFNHSITKKLRKFENQKIRTTELLIQVSSVKKTKIKQSWLRLYKTVRRQTKVTPIKQE